LAWEVLVRQRQTKCRALQTNFVAGQERLIADGLRPAARLDDEPPQKGGNDACFGRHEEKKRVLFILNLLTQDSFLGDSL